MKLVLSLLKRENPRAFEVQTKQVGFEDKDIETATLFRIWKMEEFPSKTYEILNDEHRQISCKVKFKAEDFYPAMQETGRRDDKRTKDRKK